MNAICADAVVARQPEEVFAWLSDLHNHWRLEDRFIEVAGIEPKGGRVRMQGPLGLSREARTRVINAVLTARRRDGPRLPSSA